MRKPIIDTDKFSTAAPADLPYVEVPEGEVYTGTSDTTLEDEIDAARADGRIDIVDILIRHGKRAL